MRKDVTGRPLVSAEMLGMPGFVVLAAGEYGGELELLIETVETTTGCPDCGVVAEVHARRPHLVRDVPGGRSAGAAGVVQTGLAVPGTGLRAADVDRDASASAA